MGGVRVWVPVRVAGRGGQGKEPASFQNAFHAAVPPPPSPPSRPTTGYLLKNLRAVSGSPRSSTSSAFCTNSSAVNREAPLPPPPAPARPLLPLPAPRGSSPGIMWPYRTPARPDSNFFFSYHMQQEIQQRRPETTKFTRSPGGHNCSTRATFGGMMNFQRRLGSDPMSVAAAVAAAIEAVVARDPGRRGIAYLAVGGELAAAAAALVGARRGVAVLTVRPHRP